jgi:hypothetical protein
MFCVTHEFDPEVMQSFDCDACIEITDPLLFFLALTAQMHKQVEAAMLRVCHYLDRYGLHDGHNEFAPQTLKPPRFAHQNEVRLVWDPIYPKGEGPGFELAPIFLKCTEAARYCRRLI